MITESNAASPESACFRPDIAGGIARLLEGSSLEKKIHWDAFIESFVGRIDLKSKEVEPKNDGLRCTRAELVSTMNRIIMPHGMVSGSNHSFWNGLPG